MAENKGKKTLQSLVKPILSFSGAIVALTMMGFTLYSIYLVWDSANNFPTRITYVSRTIVVITFFMVASIIRINSVSDITITRNGKKQQLDNFLPMNIFLILCGFIQTLFWVNDSGNDIHEPRSVLILAVAGSFAYFRQQYVKQSKKSTLNLEE